MKKQRKTKRKDLVWVRMSLNQHQHQGQPTDVWEQIHQTGPMGFLQKLMKIFK